MFNLILKNKYIFILLLDSGPQFNEDKEYMNRKASISSQKQKKLEERISGGKSSGQTGGFSSTRLGNIFLINQNNNLI